MLKSGVLRGRTVRPFSKTTQLTQSRSLAIMAQARLKVAVTGSAGRTGALVVKKLLERAAEFETRAVVRNSSSKPKLTQLGLEESAILAADISQGDAKAFEAAFTGCDAVVIATSAVPVLKPLSLIPVFWAKLTGGKGVMPQFGWKEGQNPEQVDWLGQKVQIDAAKATGVKKVVLISSMGGTDKDNNLNKLGNGNILQWKRKAEQYLIASGLTYTIIHPGGLIDEADGQRQLVVGVDDTLLKETMRSIPRGDVAELSVRCLTLKAAENRAFDVITRKPGEGEPTKDFGALLTNMSSNCDYSINSQWP
ncbi:hypothetical protein VOLCADRAFT_84511 [Volvox carteri f. nagariensis]|uniref:NAD(P)-binding domain-containing protein n=1 Tax=Volvox carteri f. nagariensis TaxID=3068 RepID=D8UIW1_VOLCA|nr:uncharacterized protein VOLCADRAFT_84511 [Volvox carteri f. nagariensis]EFJ40324.1 hypothetical protein VOLCADRAFT_84511 [Volvox carteri f. nagariensis]|eukprot:XP_002958587.1 hypothetical protein VOLCADRAFT_84511 [Volvox carteri f. nagariensis]